MTETSRPNSFSDVTEGSKAHIFSDPKLQSDIEKDPLFQFINKYWFQILVVIGIGAVIYFISNSVKDAQRERLSMASENFTKYVQDFSKLNETEDELAILSAKTTRTEDEGKRLQDLTKRRDEIKERLGFRSKSLVDAPQPYRALSIGIDALLAAHEGSKEEIQTFISQFPYMQYKPESSERLVSELALLGISRALLDRPELADIGKENIRSLAQNGAVVNVSAALTLARLARDDNERTAAISLLRSIREKEPEQNDLIKNELLKVGMSLE